MIQGAVFLAGRVPALLAQASGLSLRASLEIGSSFGVKCHQIGTKTEIVAHSGDEISESSIFGAGEENRTPVSTLGRSHNGRYTTPALLACRQKQLSCSN